MTRASTPMKKSLWALKPNASEYTFVAFADDEKNESYKTHYLTIYPNSVFKIAKQQPNI
jgi:hypothetical protein